MDSYLFLKKELKLIDVQFDYLSKKIIEKKIIEHSKNMLFFVFPIIYSQSIYVISQRCFTTPT